MVSWVNNERKMWKEKNKLKWSFGAKKAQQFGDRERNKEKKIAKRERN
jgi:hypothetical protein